MQYQVTSNMMNTALVQSVDLFLVRKSGVVSAFSIREWLGPTVLAYSVQLLGLVAVCIAAKYLLVQVHDNYSNHLGN